MDNIFAFLIVYKLRRPPCIDDQTAKDVCLKSSCIVYHIQLAIIADHPFLVRLISEALEVLTDGGLFGHGSLMVFRKEQSRD